MKERARATAHQPHPTSRPPNLRNEPSTCCNIYCHSAELVEKNCGMKTPLIDSSKAGKLGRNFPPHVRNFRPGTGTFGIYFQAHLMHLPFLTSSYVHLYSSGFSVDLLPIHVRAPSGDAYFLHVYTRNFNFIRPFFKFFNVSSWKRVRRERILHGKKSNRVMENLDIAI